MSRGKRKFKIQDIPLETDMRYSVSEAVLKKQRDDGFRLVDQLLNNHLSYAVTFPGGGIEEVVDL